MAREMAVAGRVRVHEPARWLIPTLVILFFLTGAAGLIYQVLWLRLLSLVFGVTTWAASTVLSSFMGGLALGSYLAGRMVDRARSPLAWYGVAEILVGLSALATPAALDLVERLYVQAAPALPQSLGLLTLVRFVLSSIVLLVPTTLMGATLPIIIKSSLFQSEHLGERVSLLYATNTAGAIAGTLLAGFYLIGGVGISVSFQLAAAINILVGIASLGGAYALGAARTPRQAATGARTIEKAADTEPATPERVGKVVLAVFAVSGFATLALEILWFRILLQFMSVTTYAFTFMLTTVLAGIALGSYVVTPLMRRRLDWVKTLAYLEIAMALTAVLSVTALTYGYEIQRWLDPLLGGRPAVKQFTLMLAVTMCAILPTTLLWGMAFPIGLRLWASAGRDADAHTGERIGVFYSLNVFGAILGSVAAGFLILPTLGSRNGLIAVAALSLLSGIALFLVMPAARRRLALSGSLIGAGLFVIAAGLMPDPFSLSLAHRHPGNKILWQDEGVQTTVTIQQRPDGSRVLFLDSMGQADDTPGLVMYHHLLGHMPMMIHPKPQRVLVVGLGGGATPGAISRHAGVSVDVVELSANVVRGAEWFGHINAGLLQKPNVRVKVDDGRNHLLLTKEKYDIITADIIFPYNAGAGALYSAEYFQLARNALTDDGLMLQWIASLPDSQYKLLMRTFLSVFPDATLWYNGSMLVGTKRPLQLNPADFERKLQDPTTGPILREAGFPSFDALLAQYWAGPAEMREFVGEGGLLTDDRPQIEYYLSMPRGEPTADIAWLRGRSQPPVKR